MINLNEQYLYSEIVSRSFVENLDENFKGIIIVCKDIYKPIGYIVHNDFGISLRKFFDEQRFEFYENFNDFYKEYNNLTFRLIKFINND